MPSASEPFPASLMALIERRTGKSIEQLKRETLWQKRYRLFQKNRQPMRFVRRFPVIGRGCVMGDRVVSSADLNQEIDQRLGR